MSDIKVATRYAKALLDEAVKNKKEEDVKSDIDLFLEVCQASRKLRIVLGNPIIGFDKKYDILKEIFEEKILDITLRFFHIVCKKGRSVNLIEIAESFEDQYYFYKNINRASIKTAISINKDLKNEFARLLEEGFGKKIELKDEVDEELIGGFVLRMNDRQIDESIRHRLNLLKLDLIDQSYKSKL